MSGTATPREEILRNLERHEQAAGHAGVMRSGSLIIKPCTQAEIDFYALATQTQPLFAQWMPTYMGQLTLNKPGNEEQDSIGTILESERFEQAVVLENLEWGFRRPSVLDIKLGKILTDEFVSEEKRMRLEKVSMSTTSWDNHLRLTGMRVYLFKGLADVGLGSSIRRTYCVPQNLWKIIDNVNPPRWLFKLFLIIIESNT
jgi:inositol-polyphosphate multikinase